MKDNQKRKRLLVIGGGAAGFFCAINCASLIGDPDVYIVEKSSKLLSKVRISGGGRCNVTHDCDDIGKMSDCYPRGSKFIRKCFHQFFTNDTIDWFSARGVRLKTEADGRMFPVTDDSATIINCLLGEANKLGIKILMNHEVSRISKEGVAFRVVFMNGHSMNFDCVCISTGGYPKKHMFDWISELGHTIIEPVPSLFTFNLVDNPLKELMGVSINDTEVRIVGTKLSQRGPLLITHWGLSGPAILKLSAWGARELAKSNYDFHVRINWVPELSEEELKQYFQDKRHASPRKKIAGDSFPAIPNRLWQFLVSVSSIESSWNWSDLPAANRSALIHNLGSLELRVKGKTTFKEEFVTAGGINLAEIDPATMMSRKIDGLFFAGEVMDVDGITGGYNFQHAWTSGFIAAKGIVRYCS